MPEIKKSSYIVEKALFIIESLYHKIDVIIAADKCFSLSLLKAFLTRKIQNTKIIVKARRFMLSITISREKIIEKLKTRIAISQENSNLKSYLRRAIFSVRLLTFPLSSITRASASAN